MTRHRIIVIAAILFATTLPADAQKFIYKLNRSVDYVLEKLYWRADIDTTYVTRPKTKWTLLGRFNVTGAKIIAKGIEEGKHFNTELKAAHKMTLSGGVSYRGLTLNLALNPAKLLGKYHDYELGLRSYARRMGGDIAYQDASNFKGWAEMDGMRENITTSEKNFKLRTLNANGYYVFNHRRFSYPAAFTHSYIQHRSSGSFLLTLSGQGQHGKADDNGQTFNFKITNIALGAGYGYNYVPARNWLIHLSALPAYLIYCNASLTMSDTRIPLRHHFPEGIITSRGSIVRQIGRNMFAGFSMTYYFTNIGYEKKLAIDNQKWNTRLYFGVRL